LAISIVSLNDFQTIFSGNQNAYGEHTYPNKETKNKEGINITETKSINSSNYKKHLEGEKGLGIIPIRKNNTCSFAVLDVDVYEKEVLLYIDTVYKNKIPLLPFRSKSGGLHLYLFLNKPFKVSVVKSYMEEFRLLLGLNNKTEIFPKQEKLLEGQVGNWINLPYYNAENTRQFLYDKKEEPILFEEAILIIKKSLQSENSLTEFFENLDLFDAPPCLQSIYYSGVTNFRNEYLFSLSCYYKAKFGDDFEFKISEANNHLQHPINVERLIKTIISSHKKKDYAYKCNNEPLSTFCNKHICSQRKFGIGSGEISELTYGQFFKYTTDPPYYEWIINDSSLKFYNELEIINQDKFRQLCFRKLNLLPNRLKIMNWTKILNTALKNIQIKNIQSDEDISPGALFKEYLYEFLEKRAMAQNRSQILVDRVFKDDKLEAYIFKPKNLLIFLINQKQFRYYGLTEIQDKLKQLKAGPLRYYVDNSVSNLRVWTLPYSGLKLFIDEDVSDTFEVDFKEEFKDEPF